MGGVDALLLTRSNCAENFVFEHKGEDSNMKLIDFGCALEVAPQEVVSVSCASTGVVSLHQGHVLS